MEGSRDQTRLAFNNASKKSDSCKAQGEPDALAAASSGASGRSPSDEGMEGKRQTSEGSVSSNSSAKHTKEQEEAAQTILKCKDYYEVLGLTKTCTDEDLKMTYRKLAKKFHPDKNHAPSATEAMKSINNAYNVLSDPEERRLYDSSENETDATQRPQHTTNHQTSSHYNQQYAAQDQQRTELQDHLPAMLIGAGLVVGALLLLDWLLERGPAYSLQQDSTYVIRRTTENLSVRYFVERDFLSCHGDKIAEIEEEVENEFLNSLLHD